MEQCKMFLPRRHGEHREGGMECWNDGRMEEWRNGGMEEWNVEALAEIPIHQEMEESLPFKWSKTLEG